MFSFNHTHITFLGNELFSKMFSFNHTHITFLCNGFFSKMFSFNHKHITFLCNEFFSKMFSFNHTHIFTPSFCNFKIQNYDYNFNSQKLFSRKDVKKRILSTQGVPLHIMPTEQCHYIFIKPTSFFCEITHSPSTIQKPAQAFPTR